MFVKGGDLKLSVYVDADYANKDNDRRSVSGVAVMVGGTDVNASSTTQHCVTLSTSEAEYYAIAESLISGGRTKHIDVRHHFIRKLVERKVLGV